MKLPNDISRCNNESCPLKNSCLRWLTFENATGMVLVSNFHPIAVDYCENKIEVKTENEFNQPTGTNKES